MKKEQSKFKTNRRQERSKYIEQGHNKNRASIEHNLYQYRTGIEHERNKYKKRTQQEQRRYENKSKAGRPTVRHENGDEFGNRNIGRSPMFEAAGRNDLFEFRIQLFEFSNRNSGKNRKIFMPAPAPRTLMTEIRVFLFYRERHKMPLSVRGCLRIIPQAVACFNFHNPGVRGRSIMRDDDVRS